MTALEWLANELYEKFEMKGDGALFNDLVNQAKEMEKQQIINFTNDFINKHTFGDYEGQVQRNKTSEQYYNEQFKNK